METFHKFFTSTLLASKRLLLVVSFFAIGLIFLAYGLISFLQKSQSQDTLQFSQNSNEASESAKLSPNTLTVDVSGAVVNPGVYHIAQDARIQDALIAAGGLSDSADRTWVAKSINLAKKLSDGAKVYIPSVGEVAGAQTQAGSSVTQSVDAAGESSTVATVNINSASVDALDSLPGIGKVTAQKIIDNRPYSDINELLSKKVVGASVFGKIKDRISVN